MVNFAKLQQRAEGTVTVPIKKLEEGFFNLEAEINWKRVATLVGFSLFGATLGAWLF